MISRPVKDRANFDELKKLVEESGLIVINICIDKDGRVVFAEYNDDESTIHSSYLAAESERLAKTIRYHKDYTAASRDCGKFRFRIKNLE